MKRQRFFPALGKGVVDFPAVSQTKQYIAESVAYIRSLGKFQ